MRHIIALSGGKDSTALAIYLRKKHPHVVYEYAFCDTGREFPSLYKFLSDLEDKLEINIRHLDDYGRNFDYYLERWNYYLPGKSTRWCTKHLKIRPFERFCKESLPCTVYIAIRADEDESRGNYGTIKGIEYTYPFREDGITKEDVFSILKHANIELPDYYKWRSTGGCWMCPWQRKSEWLGLKTHHPDLFEIAVSEEKKAAESSSQHHATTWSLSRRPLLDMVKEYERQLKLFPGYNLEFDERPCIICAK